MDPVLVFAFQGLQPGLGRPSLCVRMPAVGGREREPVKLPLGFSVLHGVTMEVSAQSGHGE